MEWLTAVARSPLILLAHPIGFLWFVAHNLTSFHAVPNISRILALILPALARGAQYLFSHGRTNNPDIAADWRDDPFYWMNGFPYQISPSPSAIAILILARSPWLGNLSFLPAFAAKWREGQKRNPFRSV